MKFTEQDIADAKFYAKTAMNIRTNARIVERKKLSVEEVAERVEASDKERFLRGKQLERDGALV